MHFPLSQVLLLHCPILGNAELQNLIFYKKSDFAQIIIDLSCDLSCDSQKEPPPRAGTTLTLSNIITYKKFTYPARRSRSQP